MSPDKKAAPKPQEPIEQPKQAAQPESQAAPSKPASRLRRRPTRNL